MTPGLKQLHLSIKRNMSSTDVIDNMLALKDWSRIGTAAYPR